MLKRAADSLFAALGAAAASEPIAVVGLAGRFPGGQSLEESRRNLWQGAVESIATFPRGERPAPDVLREQLSPPQLVLSDEWVTTCVSVGYGHQPGLPPSPGGRCRIFDIHSVTMGSAVNHEDSVKIVFTAPCIGAQAGVIAEAFATAGIEPKAMGYVEAHGTATELGDPAEVPFPTRAFRIRTYTWFYSGPAAKPGACLGDLTRGRKGIPDLLGRAAHYAGLLSPDGHCRSERVIGHTGTETRPRPLREAVVGNIGQWAQAVCGDGLGVVVLKPLTADFADGDSIHVVLRDSVLPNDGADTERHSWPLHRGPRRAGVCSLGLGGTREALESQLGWWQEKLAGAPPVLDLPANRARFEVEYSSRRRAVVLAWSSADRGRPVAELSLLTEAERRQVLVERNDSGVAPGWQGSVRELFERQARKAPDALAVEFDGQAISYGELAARAGRLARRLCALGVGPEVPVGLCAERSIGLIEGLLAIWGAGGACVPISPSSPRERVSFLLEATRLPVLLTQRKLLDALPEHAAKIVLLNGDEVSEEGSGGAGSLPMPGSLAYVIYTSGSTGRPKRIGLSHGAIASYYAKTAAFRDFSLADRLLQFSGLSFNTAFEQIVPPLLCGGAPWGADETIGRILTDGHTRHMHPLVTEGDAIPRGLVALWWRSPFAAVRLQNGYGPTEAVTSCTFCPTPAEPDWIASAGAESIGRPIPGRRVYLLDAAGLPVPVGVPGELYLGGSLPTRGYVGRPALTAERFVPDPFGTEPGGRLYRTGDLARWALHGDPEFLGRLDHQVKVRGFRIELGEIEVALSRHFAVAEAVVALSDAADGKRRLVAWVVPAGVVAPTAGELRSFLRKSLPEHMVPVVILVLSSFLRTPDGKVDRRVLPAPEEALRAEAGDVAAAASQRANRRAPHAAPAVDRQGLLEAAVRRAPDPAELPVSFTPAASHPNAEPPKVFYRGLLSNREDSRLGAWLRKATSSLFPWFRTARTEPVRQLVLMVDTSGSISPARELTLSFSHSRPDNGAEKGSRLAKILVSPETDENAGSGWESLFESLYGDSLPNSAAEPADVWGKRLARSLLAPAGQLPMLRQFDRSRLIEILTELPGWKEKNGAPRSAWTQAAARNCYRYWLEEKEEPRHAKSEISWRAAERCGFFLNRALSYPDRYIEEHGEGLSQLGGLTRAMSLAWLILYRTLAVLPMDWKLPIRRSRTVNLFTMADVMARAWGVEVRTDSVDHMNTFLVRMQHRAVIFLRKQLDPRHQAWGVCHELAHIALGHIFQSSYGLDPRSLSTDKILMFARQETTADALASLWLHLFDGLADIGAAIGRASRTSAQPRRKRAAAPDWREAPTWRHPKPVESAPPAFSLPS